MWGHGAGWDFFRAQLTCTVPTQKDMTSFKTTRGDVWIGEKLVKCQLSWLVRFAFLISIYLLFYSFNFTIFLLLLTNNLKPRQRNSPESRELVEDPSCRGWKPEMEVEDPPKGIHKVKVIEDPFSSILPLSESFLKPVHGVFCFSFEQRQYRIAFISTFLVPFKTQEAHVSDFRCNYFVIIKTGKKRKLKFMFDEFWDPLTG